MYLGLITYHSAYNFGSVLQAYATQTVLRSLGHDVEIINYRPRSQMDYYKLFPIHTGKKRLLKSFISLPLIRQRILREKKYESLFLKLFNLTQEINEPEQLNALNDQYDVYISGSDQIWNKNSNELRFVEWRKYMSPYLLEFTENKKISYGSSINSMQDTDLKLISDSINKFAHISMREASSAKRIESLVECEVETVLDPTLLLDKFQWKQLIQNWVNPYYKGKYILYYNLRSVKEMRRDIKYLKKIAVDRGLKIIVLAPLAVPIVNHLVINAADADAIDFLGLISSADLVVTNSYHGTLFSANFGKCFFSLQKMKGADIRVEDVAERLGFQERVIYNAEEINPERNFEYKTFTERRNELRKKSLNYLDNAIKC